METLPKIENTVEVWRSLGKTVDIYYNLRKKCLSIRHKGRLLGHTEGILMRDCRFVVSEKGRARVLSSKRKNVHAVIRGRIGGLGMTHELDLPYLTQSPNLRKVTYDPYKYSSFVFSESFSPVRWADYAFIVGKNIFVK